VLNSQSREVLLAADAMLYGLAYSGTAYLTGYGATARELR
jgi:hypothetical protein